METKDFDTWNARKKAIHLNAEPRIFFHPRELWFTHLGTNIGFEQDGRGPDALRPVLVIRKFNNEVLWALPLTRTNKLDIPYYAQFPYFPFPDAPDASPLLSVAILSQLRLVDAKRLRYKMGTVPLDEFEDIKEKVRRLLA